MSFLKKLFGMGAAEPKAQMPVETLDYNGYHIATMPMAEGGQFRLCAHVSKEVGGELKTHKLIRADMLPTKEEASTAAIRKSRQVIDEQGERIFR